MKEFAVKFEKPVWWLFIMAFRYAVNRETLALKDIEYELTGNLDILSPEEQRIYLEQMVEETAHCVMLDRGLKDSREHRYHFMVKCWEEINNRGINVHPYTRNEYIKAVEYWREKNYGR